VYESLSRNLDIKTYEREGEKGLLSFSSILARLAESLIIVINLINKLPIY